MYERFIHKITKLILINIGIVFIAVGCKNTGGGYKYEDFLDSTGLDYEKAIQESSIENGVNVYHYCYYDEIDEEKYVTNPAFKLRTKSLDYEKTAVVIIDPWCDMQFDEVNKMVDENVKSYILPIVVRAVKNKVPVYIFTNNPDKFSYNTEIVKELNDLVDDINVMMIYYDEVGGTKGFCETLEGKNIDNLLYMGYATQLCMLYRNSGIIPMWYNSKINLYVIPEGTLALVDDNNNELNMEMRNNICTMLSQQGVADIITFKDIIDWLD